MDILYLMIICSVTLAVIFLIIFIISAKNGQFEDDESPGVRILLESEIIKDEEHMSKIAPKDGEKTNNNLEEKSD